MIEQPIAQPQAGDIMLLRGHRQHVRVVYVGSRFARITDLDGHNSRLAQKRDLQPLPPPVEPPKPRPRMSSLDEEFMTWDHK